VCIYTYRLRLRRRLGVKTRLSTIFERRENVLETVMTTVIIINRSLVFERDQSPPTEGKSTYAVRCTRCNIIMYNNNNNNTMDERRMKLKYYYNIVQQDKRPLTCRFYVSCMGTLQSSSSSSLLCVIIFIDSYCDTSMIYCNTTIDKIFCFLSVIGHYYYIGTFK